MAKELIDYDPITGISLSFDYNEQTGKLALFHDQDVEPILEQNQQMQNDTDYKSDGIKRGWQHVAHIPDIVIMQWKQEGIDVFNPDHLPAVKRKLRDPNWRKLRTTLGNI